MTEARERNYKDERVSDTDDGGGWVWVLVVGWDGELVGWHRDLVGWARRT
jgi:hypothetical protein